MLAVGECGREPVANFYKNIANPGGSPLALAQASEARRVIAAACLAAVMLAGQWTTGAEQRAFADEEGNE